MLENEAKNGMNNRYISELPNRSQLKPMVENVFKHRNEFILGQIGQMEQVDDQGIEDAKRASGLQAITAMVEIFKLTNNHLEDKSSSVYSFTHQLLQDLGSDFTD